MSNARQCFECRNGEHDNYDDYVLFTVVRNLDDGRAVRGWMCGEHREMNLNDGYTVTIDRRPA